MALAGTRAPWVIGRQCHCGDGSGSGNVARCIECLAFGLGTTALSWATGSPIAT